MMVDLKDRKTFIGGSDAPVILGISSWKDPYTLWLEKTGLQEPDDLSDNERVHFGTILEDVVAKEFSERTGYKVRRVNERIVSRIHGFAAAQIDRKIVGGGILECKTTGAEMKDYWGPEGTNQIPIHYWAQVQHQLMVTGEKRAYVAVLIGGNTFRTYSIERDNEFIEVLVEAERAFFNLVQNKTPPNPSTYEEAAKIWKRAPAEVVYGNARAKELACRYNELKEKADAIDAEIDEVKKELAGMLNDKGDTLIVGGEVVATWKAANTIDDEKLKEDHPAEFMECATLKLSTADLRKKYPALAKQYEVPGERRLLVKKVAK